MYSEPIFTFSLIVLILNSYFIIFKLWKAFRTKINAHFIAFFVSIMMFQFLKKISLFIWILIISWFPSKGFDMTRWRTEPYNRFKQTPSLIYTKKLNRLSKEETLKILGEPDTRASKDIWTYILGNRPGFHIDPDILVFYFNENLIETYKVLCEGEVECDYY